MGAFKLTLPWRGTTVIGQVVQTLSALGLAEIVVVTGHRAADVEAALTGRRVGCVFNPHYAGGEMLSSIQTGLAALSADSEAVLVCLGDQPQMETATVAAVLAEGERTEWRRVVIPSYQMRSGHPILLPIALKLQIMDTTDTLRAILRANSEIVQYVLVDTPTVLADLDTPEDYAQAAGSRLDAAGKD